MLRTVKSTEGSKWQRFTSSIRSRICRPGSTLARFEEARTKAGVRAQRVSQPIDDDKYIYAALDFDTVEEAEAFKGFLETRVWTSQDASPALDGTPKARILTAVS
jgi:hypothetical protein